MAFVLPVVQDPGNQQHRPNGPDVLDPSSLPVATNTSPGIVQGLATPAEAIAGADNTKAITPLDLAAVIATLADLTIAAVAYNAATGVLTLTRSDSVTFAITVSDVEITTIAAPPSVNAPEISTVRFGGGTSYLGTPDGWFSINGKKVPFYN